MRKKALNTISPLYLPLLVILITLAAPLCDVWATQTRTVSGEVLSVDKETRTITIESYSEDVEGIRAFELPEDVFVTRGRETRSLDDISVGDFVIVIYHQDSQGLDVVDRIVITSQTPEDQA